MTTFYNARGNIYGVISPTQLFDLGFVVPATAHEAAAQRERWAPTVVETLCGWGTQTPPPGAKSHRCDGLLVGPFQGVAPFDLLIVNTDGTLAERSGNGLTIFAQALTDQGLLTGTDACELRVHHDQRQSDSPVSTSIKPAQFDGVQGFWLALGKPRFGPSAVDAHGVGISAFNDRELSEVGALAELDARWHRSQFVRVGNPHCVTLVDTVEALPSNRQMLESPLAEALTAIAFAPPLGRGEPCAAGVNLQWAMLQAPGKMLARVFERGEGPTESSGTSASAVACAAWYAGLLEAGDVQVEMPGGIAPIQLQAQDGELVSVSLFGQARRDETR